jgi:CRP-like cAMP-binding protein
MNRFTLGHRTQTFHKGAIVFEQGDAAESVYHINRGKIKLTIVSQNGKEAVIAILGDGIFFGEAALAGQTMRTATASAMVDSTIEIVAKDVMAATLRDDPMFAALFITHLLARGVRAEEDLADHLFNSSEKRLARALLLLANFGQASGPIEVIPKISQETLAEMIGTTRSRVSFFLNRFRSLGYIEYNGEIHVHASLLNMLLHD